MSQMTWEEWVEENPLKKWMQENEVTQVALALQLKRSPYTIHMWSRGIIPDTQNATWFWGEMIKLTGDNAIEERWRRWERTQPKLPGAR